MRPSQKCQCAVMVVLQEGWFIPSSIHNLFPPFPFWVTRDVVQSPMVTVWEARGSLDRHTSKWTPSFEKILLQFSSWITWAESAVGWNSLICGKLVLNWVSVKATALVFIMQWPHCALTILKLTSWKLNGKKKYKRKVKWIRCKHRRRLHLDVVSYYDVYCCQFGLIKTTVFSGI